MVKVCWNTHADGSPVDHETVNWQVKEAPISIFGPFESMDAAKSWMDNDYPDGDTDVHDMFAGDYDIPEDYYINEPSTVLL